MGKPVGKRERKSANDPSDGIKMETAGGTAGL